MVNSGIITYPQKTVFITTGDYMSVQTGLNSVKQLSRIQDISWSVNYNLQNESYLDAGTETVFQGRPTVLCNLTYLTTDGYNEKFMGINVSPTDGIFKTLNDQKNVYIVSSLSEGRDAAGANFSGSQYVIGLGQALINSYSLNVQLGGVMTSSVTLEALNAVTYTGVSGQAVPSVNPIDGSQLSGQFFTLPSPSNLYKFTEYDGIDRNTLVNKGSSVRLEFQSGSPFASIFGVSGENCMVQSARLDMSFNRQSMKTLGAVFPSNRPLSYPITLSFGIEAYMTDKQIQALNSLKCMTTSPQAIIMKVVETCSGVATNPLTVMMSGLQLSDQNETVGIGRNQIHSFNWSLTINGVNDTKNIVKFIS